MKSTIQLVGLFCGRGVGFIDALSGFWIRYYVFAVIKHIVSPVA